MFNFKKRKINKIGGSYMISLPHDWVRDIGYPKKVNVHMDKDKKLIVEVEGNVLANCSTASTEPSKEKI
ncbi:hypothetical protein D5R95_01955 [Methanosalsum natronophilum]|uniref:AbrB/MazE/SpoVT family DNA-binding domain-containing protein n=1 Tax=Methanosalsum natronophilum TaxID=768733 RepID=A0A3R7XVI8_9EURY|nr:MAG: hypothetical protein D5R95_01955 [Methanosalsum natronophilum]